MKKHRKRILSLIIISLIVCLFPATVFAYVGGEGSDDKTIEVGAYIDWEINTNEDRYMPVTIPPEMLPKGIIFMYLENMFLPRTAYRVRGTALAGTVGNYLILFKDGENLNISYTYTVVPGSQTIICPDNAVNVDTLETVKLTPHSEDANGDTINVAKVNSDPIFVDEHQPTYVFGGGNADIATIDAVTGEITIIGLGTTEFTIDSEATGSYKAADKKKVRFTVKPVVSSVSVSPERTSVERGKTQQFTARVDGVGVDDTVTWSVNGTDSKIDATGRLTVGANETEQTLTVTATSSFDSSKNATASVTVKPSAAVYRLTVINGSDVSNSGPYHEEGAQVRIQADAVTSGRTFDKWQGGADSIFISGDRTSPTTTITMPAGDVEVTATYKSNHYSGGGSSSGDSSSSDVIIEPSKPTEEHPAPPTTGVIEPVVKVDKNGNVKVEVSDKDIQNAIDKALVQAKKDGIQENGICVAIDLTGLKTQFNTLPLTLSKNAYDKLVKAGVKSLDIRTPQISLSLDLATLKTIHASATGDITISAVKVDVSKLPSKLSVRPVYDLTITSGSKTISSFGGYVTITLPYVLQAGEQGSNLQMVYVDEDGKLKTVTDSSYDIDAKVLTGRTNHFTMFGIVNKSVPPFSDIERHWVRDILFVAS